MNILITSAGRRVSLVKFFMKHLKKKSPLSKVFAADSNPEFSSACQIADQCFCVSKIKSGSYINELLAICVKYNVKLLIPTIDTELELFSKNSGLFLQIGAHCIVSDENVIKSFGNKHLTSLMFNKIGIASIEEYTESSVDYPIYIKPMQGSSSTGNRIVYSKKEFDSFNNGSYIMQKYIEHEIHDEYTVDLYFDRNSKLKCIVPRLRLEIRAGEVSKTKTIRDSEIINAANKLSKINGIRGCINMQVFKNKNNSNIIGIEVNARFGGGFPLLEYCGANYTSWLIDEYLFDKEIPYCNDWLDQKIMLRYDAEVVL